MMIFGIQMGGFVIRIKPLVPCVLRKLNRRLQSSDYQKKEAARTYETASLQSI